MQRKTLDIMFSVGGLFLAALLLVMGIVLTSNASFAKDYTGDQLSAQGITFKAVDKLTAQYGTLFVIAVAGAFVFALCTVASSIAVQWVIDEVILPRFEEGRVATSTVVAGCLLVFIPALGSFLTADLLGGAKQMMIGNLV